MILFQNGFGLLPGKNPNPLERASTSKVNVVANWDNLPDLPNVVTIIRKRNALPNSTVLKNVTSALNIPIGTLGSEPVTKSMAMSWRDAYGYQWSYDVERDRLEFEKVGESAPLTSKLISIDDALIHAVGEFMRDRGLLSGQWSSPYLIFSWNDWQESRAKEGRCMSSRTIDIIRKMALESSLDYDL